MYLVVINTISNLQIKYHDSVREEIQMAILEKSLDLCELKPVWVSSASLY